MKKQSLVKGAFVLTLAAFISKILVFINTIVLSRILGPEGIGLQKMVMPWKDAVHAAQYFNAQIGSGNQHVDRNLSFNRGLCIVIGLFEGDSKELYRNNSFDWQDAGLVVS